MSYSLTERQRCELLKQQLDTVAAPMRPWWEELGLYFAPYRPRFTVSTSLASRRSNTVLDGTPFLVLETFSAGLSAYVSPAESDWSDLTTVDPDLMEDAEVADWCADSTERLHLAQLKSNTYNAIPMVYEDLGAFGTAAMIVEDDPREVFRCHSRAIGTYAIGQSDAYEVDTYSEEFQMTARQMMDRWGKDALSVEARNALDTANGEQPFTITHLIYPNPDHRDGSKFAKYKPFAERYWESGSPQDKFLQRGGYDEFPVMVPRWSTAAQDVWGYGPGMYALGDNKSLQIMESDSLRGIAQEVRPAVIGPPTLNQTPINAMPGGRTVESIEQGKNGTRRLFESTLLPALDKLEAKQDRLRARIGRHFHEDLFMQIAQDARLQPKTAAEIHARFQELARALGKPLNRLTQDFLKPLVNRQFGIMSRRGMFRPAPEQLRGQPLRVEFTSVLAQAQRGVGTASMERYLAFAQQMATIFPDSPDNTNADTLMTKFGESIGLPYGVVRTEDELAARRAASAQAAMQQAQSERIPAMAGAAKDLAQAPLNTDSALSKLVGAGT